MPRELDGSSRHLTFIKQEPGLSIQLLRRNLTSYHSQKHKQAQLSVKAMDRVNAQLTAAADLRRVCLASSSNAPHMAAARRPKRWNGKSAQHSADQLEQTDACNCLLTDQQLDVELQDNASIYVNPCIWLILQISCLYWQHHGLQVRSLLAIDSSQTGLTAGRLSLQTDVTQVCHFPMLPT